MEVSPENQISKSNENQRLKIRNEKSPTSSLKIPNLKKRRLMFGLAGLSLQKSKIALVGSGRRSEDFRGPTNLRSYIWVSWLFHFTNRSVYYGWCQDDQSSRKKFVKTQRVLKIQISSYQKAEISSRNLNSKISWLRRVWLHSTVPVTRENEMRKGKRNLLSENIDSYLAVYQNFLGYFGLFWNKKTGCRRRIVHTEDLVAEDKLRLVSSCLGPSCR